MDFYLDLLYNDTKPNSMGDFGIKIFEQFNDALLGLPVIGGLFRHAAPFGTWYFSEITMLFFVSSVLIGVVYRMSEDKFLEVFFKRIGRFNRCCINMCRITWYSNNYDDGL